MLIGPRLGGAVADLENVFSGQRWVDSKFLPGPIGGDTDRGVWRKFMPLRPSTEIHLDGNVPAMMNVDMAMLWKLELYETETDIDCGVFVGTILDVDLLGERLLAFADENMATFLGEVAR
jgi:hypothetical protein